MLLIDIWYRPKTYNALVSNLFANQIHGDLVQNRIYKGQKRPLLRIEFPLNHEKSAHQFLFDIVQFYRQYLLQSASKLLNVRYNISIYTVVLIHIRTPEKHENYGASLGKIPSRHEKKRVTWQKNPLINQYSFPRNVPVQKKRVTIYNFPIKVVGFILYPFQLSESIIWNWVLFQTDVRILLIIFRILAS